MENIDHNTLLQEVGYDEIVFKYNFINTPWDDRTKKSKISIVVLLVSIFVASMCCVINNFVMHFRGFGSNHKMTGLPLVSPEFNCQLVKVEDYQYAARIHSLNTFELICMGAVVSDNAVLTNGACVKNRQVRLHVGSATDHHCKKGYSVSSVEHIFHEGVIGKKLVLLVTHKSMLKCATVIHIASDIDPMARAYVIGRVLHGAGGRTISRQPVNIVNTGLECSCQGLARKHQPNIICVDSLAKCPVLAGDLLVQSGQLYGLASTSLYRQEQLSVVCFADLKYVQRELKEFNIGDE